MSKYGKYIDEKLAFDDLKATLEEALGREMTEIEARKIKWLADCEYETVGVFVDLFKELGSEK